MRRAFVAGFFFLLVIAAFRRDASSQSSLTRQLAPDVYWRAAEPEKRIIANAGWVIFRDYVLVIDANFPWGARAVIPDIKKTTNKPIRYVFDTHYHSDHSFGNSVFIDAGATPICSEDCVAESKAKNPAMWEKSSADGEYNLTRYRLEHPQISFRDKLIFDDGAHRVELLRVGPGHTRGDAVAYLPKERILFAGDLCLNRPGINVADPDADPDNWVRALEALYQRDVAILIPGHGAQGAKETLKGMRDYLEDIVVGVRTGIAAGKTADQLVNELDLSKHHPWGEDKARNEPSIRAVYAKLSRDAGTGPVRQ